MIMSNLTCDVGFDMICGKRLALVHPHIGEFFYAFVLF
jgi:hypothetical protein